VPKPVAVNPEEILTPEEVAVLLRVKPSFVYEKVRRRSVRPIPCHRIGRYIRFKKSEVLLWFDATATSVKKGRR
jgi:excisionase family DNA binding protein